MKNISFNINGRIIGNDAPCFIVAEAGVNHNGEIALAKQLIDIAVDCKVDAVKFQTYKSEINVTHDTPLADYQKQNVAPGTSQLSMLKSLELSKEQHYEILNYCNEKKILFMSSPFDKESVDLLNEMKVPLFKIPSGEITNFPLLQYIANKGKPIILSTGMSTLEEVENAIDCITEAGNQQIIVLHCVSSYPTKPHDVNLKAMLTMKKKLKVPVGFSDHTLGISISLAAVSLGACIIEKHFTIDRKMIGPDHQCSLEKNELFELVQGIRDIESAMGTGQKIPSSSELETAIVSRKSIVAAFIINEGDLIKPSMLETKSPGTGIPPSQLNRIIGKKAKIQILKDQLILWDMIE